MRGRGDRKELAVFRPALVGLLLAFAGLIGVSNTALANTIDVTVDIPAGSIVILGKTSPNAQVKIYENGNEQPTSSIVADGAGNFSDELPQGSTGVVDISIRAIDTNGVNSVLITKQVAVINQQTSTLTVILPPTININPQSATFENGTMEFSGQTIPGATVTVTIEPSTILTTTADGQGKYVIPLLVQSLASVGVYTYGVEVATGNEVSDYVIAGTFIISPPIQQPTLPTVTPLQNLIAAITNNQISAPEITSPSENEFMSSKPFVISGRAAPDAEVTLYDDGVVIGVIVAGKDGNWQFYFSPYKTAHTIYARACQDERCSQNSRSILIRRPLSDTRVCRPGVSLSEYRLTAVTGKEVKLAGSFLENQSGLVVVSWGDNEDERFEYPLNNQLKVAHTYQEPGIYSGYLIVNNGDVCQTATYFAVEVTSSTQPILLIALIVAIVAGTLVIGWSAYRSLPRLRS